MMTYLAAVSDSGRTFYLSESGRWFVSSAYGPKSPQRLRRFAHHQSAKGAAETWADQLNAASSERYEAKVEVA